MTYEDLKTFRKAMKENPSLVDEYMAARVAYIVEINLGNVKMRVRGASKDALLNVLQDARQKAVKLYKSTKSEAKVPFTIMTLARYSQIPGHTTPEKDGNPTVMRTFEGKLQECVLIRDLPRGEGKFYMIDEEGAVHEEIVDDGSAVIRAGQQLDKYTLGAQQV